MDVRSEVQQFLTAARSGLTPEQAGVPVFGGNRRVPGLRREEVAQLAGVSTAYYTRIERGDLRGVSESVLHGLSQALQLDEAARTHLFDLARSASGPARASRTRPEPRLSPRLAQLIDTMQDVPTLAMSRLGTTVGSNALGRALFPDLFPVGRPPLNHTRYLFLDPRAQVFYPDWEKSAKESVAALRLLAGRDPGDRALMALIGELSTHNDDFRTWWGGHAVRTHTSGTKHLHHPVVGDLTIAYERLAVPSSPEVGLATYLAEPGSASADALDVLRIWSAGTQAENRDSSSSLR